MNANPAISVSPVATPGRPKQAQRNWVCAIESHMVNHKTDCVWRIKLKKMINFTIYYIVTNFIHIASLSYSYIGLRTLAETFFNLRARCYFCYVCIQHFLFK